MAGTSAELTQERGSTHGDYPTMSKLVMDQMRIYMASPNWDTLPDTVQVFLFNQAQKNARILSGSPFEPDHYRDIEGYAYLARKSIEPEVKPASPAAEPYVINLGPVDGGTASIAVSSTTQDGAETNQLAVFLRRASQDWLAQHLPPSGSETVVAPGGASVAAIGGTDESAEAAALEPAQLAATRPSPLPSGLSGAT